MASTNTPLPTSPVVSYNGYQNRFVVTADPDGYPYLQEQRLVDGRWVDRPGIGSNTVEAALIAVLREQFNANNPRNPMSSKAIMYRQELYNLASQTRRFLSLVPKGHPERHDAILAHRSALVMVARLAKTEGEHEYRAEVLAELAEMFDG